MKRFVSVGECMIEMSGGEDGQYRLGFAGDTLNTAWYARARLRRRLGGRLCHRARRRSLLAADGRVLCRKRHRHRPHPEDRGPPPGSLSDPSGATATATSPIGAASRRRGRWPTRPVRLNEALAGADIAYFSGISLAILGPRARGKLIKALHLAREGGARVAFDPNERPLLWTSPRVMGSTHRLRRRHRRHRAADLPGRAGAVRRRLTRGGRRALSELGRRRGGGQERRRAGLRRLARVARLGGAASRAR